jgi:hypothetical protein
MPREIEVNLGSAWQSRDGVALWITVDGEQKQVHIDRSAITEPDPYEREEALDTITLFKRRTDKMERRIIHEALHGWSGPIDFMIRGEWDG